MSNVDIEVIRRGVRMGEDRVLLHFVTFLYRGAQLEVEHRNRYKLNREIREAIRAWEEIDWSATEAMRAAREEAGS